MPAYANLSGESGVVSYEEGPDSIEVTFRSGKWRVYTYTLASCGRAMLDEMKRRAAAGHGLNSYITTAVKQRYASRR